MAVFIIVILIAGLLNSLLFQPKAADPGPDAPVITLETVPEPGRNQVQTAPGMPHLVRYPDYYGGFGSCGSIAGRTVIVSVFADDMTSHWDFQNDEDVYRYTDIFRRVRAAAEWLEWQTSLWGEEAVIICDWLEDPYLYYEAYLPADDAQKTRDYELFRDYVDSAIDSQFIMDWYQADNIVYMFHFNADAGTSSGAYTFTAYSGIAENTYFYEMVAARSKADFPAAAYAHELMHAFGVPDMYYENEFITSEYVEYLDANGIAEIMHYHPWDEKDDIPMIFTGLDAYYLGLAGYSYDQDVFGLRKSMFAAD